MVTRKIVVPLIAVALAWGCSESPVSPTDSGFGPAQGLQAKGGGGKPPKDPPPPPPPPATYTMTLGASIHDDPSSVYPGNGTFDTSQDGLPSPGYLSVPGPTSLDGFLAGPTSHDNFTGSMVGSLSGLNISAVAELPDWFSGGDPCQQDQEVADLVNRDLVGPNSSLSGSVSLTLSEFTVKGSPSVRGTFPSVEWLLEGVIDRLGDFWTIRASSGRSRSNVFPVFEDGSTDEGLVVTVENSKMDFFGPYDILLCRADYTMTLTKQ